MSYFPMFVNVNRHPNYYFDDDYDFGFSLNPKDILEFVPETQYYRLPHNYQSQNYRQKQNCRHPCQRRALKRKQESKAEEEEFFKVHFDVSEFSPEELSVKTVDNLVVIEGKHEEKEDGDCIVSRQFVRKCPIPDGCDPDTVRSSISTDGQRLTIRGSKFKESSNSTERVVQIQQPTAE